ncbi:MAG TPA: F0F1 ATP synthase subunit A [Pyrinomonadaceae bacterium]|jgi:F-type H+-transporting ATPase subunit a|nr:F0F1 ATP synthase subunit A [Pyrinomonadaceae bacterium]
MFLFAEGGEHVPLIVQFIDHYIGEPVHNFQLEYTKPVWDSFFGLFGSNAEAMFGKYTVENAVPWYTVMFFIACLLTIFVVWILKGKLSADDPNKGQMTLEASFAVIKDLAVTVIGEHAFKYFPVVATFAILILISNLMGLFPMFMAPTASVNVTYALAITSFIYYNYVGISENGLVNHIAHFTGPRLPLLLTFIITPLIFGVEIVSNLIRPFTLGVRLFANMFADEKIFSEITGLYPPVTQFLLPLLLTGLGLFVAFVQTLVFTLLSMIYISEVSHAPHEHVHGGEHSPKTGEAITTAHV